MARPCRDDGRPPAGPRGFRPSYTEHGGLFWVYACSPFAICRRPRIWCISLCAVLRGDMLSRALCRVLLSSHSKRGENYRQERSREVELMRRDVVARSPRGLEEMGFAVETALRRACLRAAEVIVLRGGASSASEIADALRPRRTQSPRLSITAWRKCGDILKPLGVD